MFPENCGFFWEKQRKSLQTKKIARFLPLSAVQTSYRTRNPQLPKNSESPCEASYYGSISG
jgi:hypothetical protein